MGRKGGGRKAFLKTAKPAGEDDADSKTAQDTSSKVVEGPPAAAAEDPSAKFLVNEQPPPSVAKDAPVQDKSAIATKNDGLGTGPQNYALQEETRGQLVQRHKKVCS